MSNMDSHYKGFCWRLGTTSFRTKNFNKTIEEQLSLLDEFWNVAENSTSRWSGNDEVQTRYYDFLRRHEFVKGDAQNKCKDARAKTSGLSALGIIDDERRLTEVGNELLRISVERDFASNNLFQIPKDSFIYLKQLLKTSVKVNGNHVRPFMLLLYVLSKTEYLTSDEFTYLLPLCIDSKTTSAIIDGIQMLRQSNITIDKIIVERLMSIDNYKEALNTLLNNDVDESIICTIGMNRKSRSFDVPYLLLYQSLYELFINRNDNAIEAVYEAIDKINIGSLWKDYLFNSHSRSAICRTPQSFLKPTLFSDAITENDFKKAFFTTMHLLKAKSTLRDYHDLNRRYIKLTDVVLFEDDRVRLDIIPRHFFATAIERLYPDIFSKSQLLYNNCAIEEIAECLAINEEAIIVAINDELGTNISTIDDARLALDDDRYRRLHHLMDTKFTYSQISLLLDLFEMRNDNTIRDMVTDSADIPTIFEYVLGILWYEISGRRGKILDYMRLSLDADLLPKTHASGGDADIVYEYSENGIYPSHSLLLEATLADDTNQRRTEMEPVSRHLGRHLIRTGNLNSYCVFITTYLDTNVISDFRNRKVMPYYNPHDNSVFVNGMKIIPLQTSELKRIISSHKTYDELYPLFDQAFCADLSNYLPHEWYDVCIKQKICP